MVFRNIARRVVNRNNTSRQMATHAQILIESLKLGNVKVKIKRTKLQELQYEKEENENTSAAAATTTVGEGRTDAEDGAGEETDGDSYRSTLSELEQEQEQEDGGGGGGNNILNRTSRKVAKKKGNERQASLTSLASQLLDKFKSTYRTVNLFTFETNKKTKRITSSSLFNHALDCHDAVIELSSQLESLLNKQKTMEDGDKKLLKLSLSDSLIVPGTLMKGTIKVPPDPEQTITTATNMANTVNIILGEENNNIVPVDIRRHSNLDPSFQNINQHTVRPYSLEILREWPMELEDKEKKVFIGRHYTFDGRRDKQIIIIEIVNKNIIYYEDYETQCCGEILDNNKMYGSVRQLKNGQPGFFISNNTDEYTFYLERKQDSRIKEIIKIRNKIFLSRYARALSFAAWCGTVSSARIINEKFINRTIDWSEILDDMVWICDEVGGLMRRYILLLNSLKFKNIENRKRTLEFLHQKGINRKHIHDNWDAVTILLRALKDNTPSASVHTVTALSTTQNFLTAIQSRLEPSYEILDKAFRKCENRVCEDTMTSWEVVFQQDVVKSLSKQIGESIEEAKCSICTDLFEIGTNMYVTPCSHGFHITCLQDWFKEASVCPLCRTDFSNL